jgi:hypothetical protein
MRAPYSEAIAERYADLGTGYQAPRDLGTALSRLEPLPEHLGALGARLR